MRRKKLPQARDKGTSFFIRRFPAHFHLTRRVRVKDQPALVASWIVGHFENERSRQYHTTYAVKPAVSTHARILVVGSNKCFCFTTRSLEMKQPPPPPMDLYGVLIPGMEMAIQASVDRLNVVCQTLRQKLYHFGRDTDNNSISVQASSGSPRYWTDEQKTEILREYDEQPSGTGAEWLRSKGLNYQHVFGWRKKLGTPKPNKQAEASDPGLPAFSGTRRVWNDEQRKEAIRQFEATGYGTRERSEFLKRNHISRNRMAEWIEELRPKKKVSPSKANRAKGATQKDILAWAKNHKGIFAVDAFQAAHPGVHVRGLGLTVRSKLLKKTDGLREFEITPKGEATLNV